MAGQRPIVASEACDLHQILTFHLPATVAQYVPLFIAERDTVIESCLVRCTVLDTTNTSLTANLAYAADGTTLGTNTDITDTALLGATNGSGLAHDKQELKLLPDTAATRNYGVPTENIVAAGKVCLLEFSAAPHSSLVGLVVTVRISTKKH